MIHAVSPPRCSCEAMWGPLVIASAVAHVGCPPARELAGPWSALAPQRSHPTTPSSFSVTPVWLRVLPPPLNWGGIWVCTLAETVDKSDEWTTVCVAPELRARYSVGFYTKKLGRTLHALTRDEWETELVSAAGGPEEADNRGEGGVSSVECDSSSEVGNELMAAMRASVDPCWCCAILC